MMKTSFSWKNYTKPTPKNLEYIAGAMRRLVAVVTGFSIIMEANEWVPIGVIMFGALLDELKNFFAHASEGDQESVTVTYPAELADQVEVKQETKTETINE